MVFELNGKFMTTILSDNTAGMILENILLAMEGIKFSKSQASGIVGSENRLEKLVESGKIRAEKKADCQNGKWFCNGADVLRYCSYKKRHKKGTSLKACEGGYFLHKCLHVLISWCTDWLVKVVRTIFSMGTWSNGRTSA